MVTITNFNQTDMNVQGYPIYLNRLIAKRDAFFIGLLAPAIDRNGE